MPAFGLGATGLLIDQETVGVNRKSKAQWLHVRRDPES
jgi:hypothetical protein